MEDHSSNNRLLTVKEVADELSISPQSVYRLIDAGKLVAHRLALGQGSIRVSRADLESYLADSKTMRKIIGTNRRTFSFRHLRT
jgi:excisionase family DNA binding protein